MVASPARRTGRRNTTTVAATANPGAVEVNADGEAERVKAELEPALGVATDARRQRRAAELEPEQQREGEAATATGGSWVLANSHFAGSGLERSSVVK